MIRKEWGMINLRFERKHAWMFAAALGVLSAILLYTGVSSVLHRTTEVRNLAAYMVLGLIIGVIAFVMLYFRFLTAFLVYFAGILVGFFEMFRAFIGGMSGWGDLIGIVSLLVWIGLGLVAGILAQLGQYLYNRYIRRPVSHH